MLSCCTVCDTPFKEGDALQAYLRGYGDPEGSWGGPVPVDAGYQARAAKNDDSIKRKHANCFPSYFEEIK